MGYGSVLSLVSSADFQSFMHKMSGVMYWFRRASKRSPRQGYGCVSKRSPQWLRRGAVKEVQRGYDNPVKEFPVVMAARVGLLKFGFNSGIMTELNVCSSDKDMEVKKE